MNKYILFCFISLFFVNTSFSQKIEVTYFKAYKNYKDESKSEPKILKNLEYKLKIDNNKARFEKVKKLENDANGSDVQNRRGRKKGVYYKDLNIKEKIHQQVMPINEELYLVTLPFNEYKWKLTKISKIISGYKCYKAITNYSYKSSSSNKEVNIIVNVWYTPDIPLPFGPDGKDGLPGLVLETHINSFYFIATKINFKPKHNFIVERPKKGIEVTKEKFSQILSKEHNKFKVNLKNEKY